MPFDESAEDEIRRFEEQYRNQPESLVFARLADAYRKSGDSFRALEVLEEGIRRHPDYLSAHIVRARTLRDLDRVEEARSAFERVLEIDAQNLVAIRGLAEIARESGDAASEITWLERLELADPQSSDSGDRLAGLRDLRATAEADSESVTAPDVEDESAAEEWWSDGPLAGEAKEPESGQVESAAAALPDREDEAPVEGAGPGLPDIVSGLWSGPAIDPVQGRVADSFAADLNAAILDDETTSRSDSDQDPTPADAWWFEPPEAPGDEAGGAAQEDEDVEDADLLTRTMAELYARQGLTDEAEAIYRELLIDRPEDEVLRSGLEAVLGMRAARAAKPSFGGEPESAAELEPGPDPEPAAELEPSREVEPGPDPLEIEGLPDGQPEGAAPEATETAGEQLRRVLKEGEEIVDRLPEPRTSKSVLQTWLEGLRG